LKECIC